MKILLSLSFILIHFSSFSCQASKKETQKNAPEVKKENFSISPVKNLKRITITKPGSEVVELEKQDGIWKLNKPIASNLADFHSLKIESLFSKKWIADDFLVPKDKLKEFYLSDKKAYKVSLFTTSDSPELSFFLGNEVAIKGSKKRGTYIKTLDGKSYRLQAELASVLRAPSTNLRSRVIFRNDTPLTSVEIRRRSGEKTRLKKVAGKWVIVEPQNLEFEIGPLHLKQLLSAFARLNVDGFTEGESLKELDLDPPFATIKGIFEDKTISIDVGHPAPKQFYVRVDNSKVAYKIRKEPGKVLSGNALAFKHRRERQIPNEDIIEFQLAGSEKVRLKKKKGIWTHGKTAIEQSRIPSLVGTFAQIVAVKWRDVSAEEAGLNHPIGRVLIKTKNSNYEFDIGKECKKDGSRYARWKDSKYVMEIPKYVWERANTPLKVLKKEAKK